MPQAAPIQQSFNAGEFSPRMWSRSDLQNYDLSTRFSQNFILHPQGPAAVRTGTRFLREVKFHDKDTIIEPFIRKDDKYILELGDGYLRVNKDQFGLVNTPKNITDIVALSTDKFTVTSAAHGLSNGDQVIINEVVGMININNRRYDISGVTPNTFDITVKDNTENGTYTSGGVFETPYEGTTQSGLGYGGYSGNPIWDEDDLQNLVFAQSADVKYIAMGQGKSPLMIKRFGDLDWRIEQYEFENGPWQKQNLSDTTLAVSATTGSVTVTASTDLFVATDVGRHIRIRNSGTWGWGVITAFTSATEVTLEVKDDFGGTAATKTWQLGALSDTTGWPESVAFIQNRLVWSRGEEIFMSESGGFNSFAISEPNGDVNDDNGLSERLNGNEGSSNILYMIDIQKGLAFGTISGEWILRPNRLNEAITPTNKSVSRSTTFGSKPIQPIRVGDAVLFVQKTGRVLGEMRFSFQNDSFVSRDLTIFSEHIATSGIKSMSYQGEPDNILWCVLNDGNIASLAYKPQEEVNGWSKHTTDGKFLDVAVVPSPDNSESQPYFIVERDVDGKKYKYIEYLNSFFRQEDDQLDAFFVDSGLRIDNRTKPSSALNILSGAVDATKQWTIPVTDPTFFVSSMVGKRIRLRWDFKGVKGIGHVEITNVVDGRTVDIKYLTDIPNIPELNGVSETIPANDWFVYSSIQNITGLAHLEGKTVQVYANGAVFRDETVVNGRITLEAPAYIACIGLQHVDLLASRDFDNGAADGTSLGKIKRIDRVIIGVDRSLGGFVGGANKENSLTEIESRDYADMMDEAIPLFTGYFETAFTPDESDSYAREAVVWIKHTDPTPFTLRAIIPKMITQDGR